MIYHGAIRVEVDGRHRYPTLACEFQGLACKEKCISNAETPGHRNV